MATRSSVLAWESHGWRGLGLQSLGSRRSDRTAQENEPSQTDMKTTVPGRVEMTEQQDVTLPFSHKHIENTRRAALEEYLLKAGRRLQSVHRASKAPQSRVGQKIRKVRKDSGWDLCPRSELCNSKGSRTLGRPPPPQRRMRPPACSSQGARRATGAGSAAALRLGHGAPGTGPGWVPGRGL